jgi:hypothetical protein
MFYFRDCGFVGSFFYGGGLFVCLFNGWRERDEEKCKERRREMGGKESYQVRKEEKGQMEN